MHSQLWGKCSKTKVSSYEKLLFAGQVTMLQHNFGYKGGSVLSLPGIASSKKHNKLKKDFRNEEINTKNCLKEKKRPQERRQLRIRQLLRSSSLATFMFPFNLSFQKMVFGIIKQKL
ncbi:hypothetical protein SK128_019466 [Halocaridina rubra]|uniref:Uncharacterized protein n=1 Tax=Halocaridina rubra TaxID=373956 RepID=A0AAN8XNC3_HALRR